MSISGSLEDVAVSDLLQFIGLGRRTGVLLLVKGDDQGQVGFYRGQITAAVLVGHTSLVKDLLDTGALTENALAEAGAKQASEGPGRSLAQVLEAGGHLESSKLEESLVRQTKSALTDMLTWERGSFEFMRDAVLSIEGLVGDPRQPPIVCLDPDRTLLELVHDLDARASKAAKEKEASKASGGLAEGSRKSGSDAGPSLDQVPLPPPAGAFTASRPAAAAGLLPDGRGAAAATLRDLSLDPEPESDPEVELAPEVGRTAASGEAGKAEEPRSGGPVVLGTAIFGGTETASELGLEPPSRGSLQRREPALQVLSADPFLHNQLRFLLPQESGALRRVRRLEAGTALPGEAPPIVLVDLRRGEPVETVARVRRTRPRATLVVVSDEPGGEVEAYKAGAVAALPPAPDAIAACIESLRRERGYGTYRAQLEQEMRSGFARLRRIMVDLRSGLLSTTVALNLMQVIADSVERAVLFLIQGDSLVAVGAFGTGVEGRPLTEGKQGPRIRCDDANALSEAAREARTQCVTFSEIELPPHLVALLGRPRTDEALLLPVVGTEKVIGVIYADNGHLDRPIGDLELLELATAQVGIAFENELLRRQGFGTF